MNSLDLSKSILDSTAQTYRQTIDPEMNIAKVSNNMQAALLWSSVIVLLIIIICVVVYVSVKPPVPEIPYSYVSKGGTSRIARREATPTSIYGSYSVPVETPCLTASGLCTDEGYKTITVNCIPNPTTGYGCIAEDGSQTFETRVQKIGCQPQCRQFIWKTEPSNAACIVDPPYNDYSLYPCLPDGVTGYTTTTQTCLPNDAYGVNSCTYLCGSNIGDDDPESQNYIPACHTKGTGTLIAMRNFNYAGLSSLPIGPVNSTSGLPLSKGYTITSVLPNGMYTISPAYRGQATVSEAQIQAIDQQLATITSCIDATREICGSWAVPNSRNSTVVPCKCQATPDYTPQCETGKARILASGLYDPTILFDFGYTSTPMKCVDSKVCGGLAGTSPICLPLSITGQGPQSLDSPCVSKLSDLTTPGLQIPRRSESGGRSLSLCTDPSNTNVPGCVQPCIFVAPPNQLDLSGIDTGFRRLIGSYVTLSSRNTSMTSGINFLTLRHVPSSISRSDSLDSNRISTEAVFYDCTGDPSKPLNPVRTLLAYSGGGSGGAYWDRAMCTTEAIMQSSSLLLMIKPFTSGSRKLDCNIIGMLGRRYIGWLDIEVGSDGLRYLIWKQAKPTIDSTFGDQPTEPRFTIYSQTNGSYNLSPYSSPGYAIYSEMYGGAPQVLSGLSLTSLDMSNPALDTYLSTRENRCVANSCDLQFDYIMTIC